MKLQSLRVRNFRIHDDRELPISDGVTVIVGGNGSGKTSLIEAIYVLLRGSSFRGNDDAMKNHESDWYRIDCTVDNEYTQRSVQYKGVYKEFTVDEKVSRRLSAKHRYPIVLFEPDVLKLFTSSPARRREYMDTILSQLDDTYSRSLRRYERALRQRNNLLKQSVHSDELFAWNVTLSEYGAYIVECRQNILARINDKINETYQSIAQKDDQIEISYSYDTQKQIRQSLMNDLERTIEKDKVLKVTTTGPHRHDMVMSFNGSPITEIASRGEIRTVVLALKFIEVGLVEEVLGCQPIILLDDVFGELDERRQKELVHSFHDYQIIITATDIPNTKLAATIVKL